MLILLEKMFIMRNFKKTLMAITAAVMCAMPMLNGITASAAGTEQYKTFRLYHEVNDPTVAYFDFSISYNSGVLAEPSMKTELCGKGNFNSIHYNLSRKIQTTYNGAAFSQTGTAATTKLLTPMSVTSLFDAISYTMPVARNASGATLNPFSVTHDYVLVGDANRSGDVDLGDAVYINQFVANPDEYGDLDKCAADVNGDGYITEEDSTLIQRYLIHLVAHF